jgi:hypothetical protein
MRHLQAAKDEAEGEVTMMITEDGAISIAAAVLRQARTDAAPRRRGTQSEKATAVWRQRGREQERQRGLDHFYEVLTKLQEVTR